MSKTVMSTGKLLVGQTTREKSLTHRLPRGVFARDDEGNFQIADGVTPGGHNPLKRRVKMEGVIGDFSYTPYSDYLYLYMAGNIVLDTDAFKLEYVNLEGEVVTTPTISFGRAGSQGFNYPTDVAEDTVMTIYHIGPDATRTDLRKVTISELKRSNQLQRDTLVETFRTDSFTVPLPKDQIELTPSARIGGAISGLTLVNGEYTGAFFSTIDPLTSYANPLGDITTIPFDASEGRDYVICDKDTFSDSYAGLYFVASYDKVDYGNCRLDIYDSSANLIQTLDLGNGLYHYRNSHPFADKKPAILYSKLGYILVAFSGRKFIAAVSDLPAFSNGDSVQIEESAVTDSDGFWMAGVGELSLYPADGSKVTYDTASPAGTKDSSDRTPFENNSHVRSSVREDEYGLVTLKPWGVGYQVITLVGETLSRKRYGYSPYDADAYTYTVTAEELLLESELGFAYDSVSFGTLTDHRNGMWQQELYVSRSGKTVVFDLILYGNTVRPLVPIEASHVDIELRFLNVGHNAKLYDMSAVVHYNGFLLFTNNENKKTDVYTVRPFTYA